MKSVFEQIENIINEELSNINQKIKGTGFLEILKFNLIENLSKKLTKLSFENIEDSIKDCNFEDDFKKISTRIILCKSPKIQLNTKLNKNLLLICLNGSIKIDIEDFSTKKYINYNLIKNTGITLSKGLNCNINMLKNVLALEIFHEDKNMDIENSKDNTI